MLLIFLIFSGFFNILNSQHWWDFEDFENPNEQPIFTPKPNVRYTHDSRKNQLSQQLNDVVVNIPKAGFGTFVGFSQRVFYDYTWTSWPPIEGRLVDVFLGIPYAAPPIDDLRFMKPIPAHLDSRYIWYAKKYKPACIQPKYDLQSKIRNFNDFSEDCLYLNIFAPNRTWESANTFYPVVIHIHGGSFTEGSSHLYPGHALASTGIVVVTFNYRLGPFGFLATGDFESIGNYGLWDQLMVLEWVRDNIKWFRGDNTKVTLMGESAGAASVGLHLVSPVTGSSTRSSTTQIDTDLFQQAIMMSGSDLSPWAVSDPDNIKTRYYVEQLAKKLNCLKNNMHAQISCLRYYKDANAIMMAADSLTALPGGPLQIWSPVVDGTAGFLPRNPKIERSQGRYIKLPFMATIVHSEGSWVIDSLMKTLLNKTIKNPLTTSDSRILSEWLVKRTNAYRFNETLEELQLRYTWWSNLANITARTDEIIDMYSDYFVKSPLYETLLYQANSTLMKDKIYFSEWAYRGINDTKPAEMGIYHGVDTKFLFGFPFMNKTFNDELYGKDVLYLALNESWTYPYDTNMSEFAMTLWSNFISIGNPTPYEIRNVTWLPFEIRDNQYYMHMYINSSMYKIYRQPQLAFWRERYNYLAQPLPAIDELREFPLYDAALATICLGVVLFVVFIIMVIVIICLIRRPNPDKFKTKVGLNDGDRFSSAFSDRFARDSHHELQPLTSTSLSSSARRQVVESNV